jgi:hypothetical protein
VGTEKRRAPRIRKRVKIDVHGTPLFTVDVSLGGFCAETARALDPGTEVAGTLTYREATYQFRGVVQWAKAGNLRLGIRARMGVRFLQVDPGFTETVLKPASG